MRGVSSDKILFYIHMVAALAVIGICFWLNAHHRPSARFFTAAMIGLTALGLLRSHRRKVRQRRQQLHQPFL